MMMPIRIERYQDALKYIALLRETGMDQNIEVQKAIWLAENTYNIERLERVLNKYHRVIPEAIRRAALIEQQMAENHYLPYPEGEEAAKIAGDYSIGIINHNREKAGIKVIFMTGHQAIIARTRVGKTVLQHILLDQMLSDPNRDYNIIIFDVKRDYEHLIRDYPNICTLRRKHLRYNHFEIHDADTLDELREAGVADMNVFSDSMHFMGTGLPMIEEAVNQVYIQNRVFEGSKNWPTFTEVLYKVNQLRKAMKGPYNQDTISKINLRFKSIVNTPGLNRKRGFPISFWQENDLVIDMQGYNQIERPLIAIGIATKLFNYNMRKGIRSHTPKTVFIFDEGYEFFDSDKDKSQFVSNYSLKTLFRQGGEYGLAFQVLAQSFGSISRYVLENISTTICFRTQDQNLKATQDNMGLTDEQAMQIYTFPEKFTGVARLPDFPRPFIFDMDIKAFPDKTVTDEEIDARMKPILDSMPDEPERVPRPPETGTEASPDTAGKTDAARKDAWAVLKELKRNPFLFKTKLFDRIGISGNDRKKTAIDFLVKEGLITEESCWVSTRKADFYPLTEEGCKALKMDPRERLLGRGGFKHTYYAKRVLEHLKDRGCRPESEGKTADYNGPKRVDVYCEIDGVRSAFEVTTNFSNVISNIEKCIEMKVDMAYIICEDQKGVKRVERRLKAWKKPDGCRTEIVTDKTIRKFLGKKFFTEA